MKEQIKNNDEAGEKLEAFLTDAMANYLDMIGGKPLLGRIWGLLLTVNEPVSLTEISRRLRVSKPAVSNTINNAMTLQVFTKVYKPEFPRENFFIASPYTIEFMFKAAEKKTSLMSEMLDKAIAILKNSNGALLPGEDMKQKYERLYHIRKLVGIISDEYHEFIERVYKQISDTD